jgi:hypothetical protein
VPREGRTLLWDVADREIGVESDAPTRAARPNDTQAEADRLIRELAADLAPDEAVYVVAVLASRAAAELHRVAKGQATDTKGSPAWGSWAALQNAARKLVLDASSARDGAARLSGRDR